MGEKTASVSGPDPHVLYSTAQPKANCDDTSHPTHYAYCSLLLGTTCVQCLYTVVYKSSQVDRVYISITTGKVDGCRLWSPRLTGGRLSMPTQRTYQCNYKKVHTPLLLFKSTGCPLHPRLWKQFQRQTKEKPFQTIICYHGSNHSILHTRIPSRRKSMATVPYYMLLVPSVSFCYVLPLGEQNLSAWSKKYAEVDVFVKKWPLVGSSGEKTSPCDIGY